MKKSFLIMASVAFMLAAVSCSSDDTPMGNGDGNATFTISLPDAEFGSRSFADGKSATKLDYAVYDASNDAFITSGEAEFGSTLSTNVNIPLANGKNYKIAFFAHDNSEVYTFDASAGSFSVDYTKMTAHNSTDYDSFFKLHETGNVTGSITQTVTLTRPMAQLNWGTSDIAEAVVTAENMYGANAAKLQTKVTVEGVYSGYNMLTGEVTGEAQTINLPLLARPADSEKFPVEPDTYTYLSMSYLLVPADQRLVKATLTPSDGTTDYTPITITSLPVQANYRTNIYGALLTTPGTFTIKKDKNFSGAHDYNTGYTQADNAGEVTSAVSHGETVQLQNDVTITKAFSFGIGKKPEIHLNGYTMTLEKQTTLGSNKTLTIDGSTSAGGKSKLVIGDNIDAGFQLSSGGSLIIKNVDIEYAFPSNENDVGSAIFITGSNKDLTMSNVTITVNSKAYAISTNASTSAKPVINLDKVTVYSYGGINCPILLNVKSTLTATGCHFEGCTNAMILRGGNYTFTDCEFVQTLLKDKTKTYDREKVKEFRAKNRDSDWGSGTAVPYACLTMGNRGTAAYQYPTNVTMDGCKITVAEGAKDIGNIDESLPAVYIYANQGDGLGVNFNHTNTTITGALEVASGNVTINGTPATVTP